MNKIIICDRCNKVSINVPNDFNKAKAIMNIAGWGKYGIGLTMFGFCCKSCKQIIGCSYYKDKYYV